MHMKNTLIFITGPTGVGKETVAKSVAESTGATLIQNQKIALPLFEIAYDPNQDIPSEVIDELFSVFHQMAYLALNFMQRAAPKGKSFIFTNPLIDGDLRAEKMMDHFNGCAKHRNMLLVPVFLDCSAPYEHMERLTWEGRDKAFKLRDPEIYRRMMEGKNWYIPQHANLLTINSAGKTAQESAGEVLTHIERLQYRDAFPTTPAEPPSPFG